MRFAATAALLAFMGFQASALGQETPVQQAPVEPSLESVITHFFPGYAPVPLGDLEAEIGALTVSESAYNSRDRSPTSVRADFDGNGFSDYALLIRKTAGPEADEIFVILMAHGEGRYSKAIESFFGGVASDIYLGYLPAGTVLPAPSDSGENAPPLILENPAATLNILGQVSDAFYWDGLSGRFMNAPAPR
ncbi:MAG: hypothetical protein IMF08_16470 [Proteobacteria bacterium]|nr:hypothetical protein [Pseudomonadota bacterium]MCK4867857.1 hypothetical protein [Alphaproteobacteria bacterium]